MQTIYRRLIGITLLLTLIVIILGAYTRLSDAGLGCPDWPGCYGHLTVPEQVTNTEFSRPLEARKAWIEMIHRYVASSLGLLILIIFALTVRYKNQLQQSLILPSLLVVVVIFQGLLGMWTVTKLLSPIIVTGHLLGGLTTLSLLWLLWLGQQRKAKANYQPLATQTFSGLRVVALAMLLLVIGQIFLGGWTSTHYAAVACGVTFPECHGELWPPANFAEGFSIHMQDNVDYQYGILGNPARTAIHLSHRAGALAVFLLVGGFALWLWLKQRSRVGQLPLLILAMLLVQVTLGILNVVLALPLAIAVAHTAGAALFLLLMIKLNEQLAYAASK